MDLSSDPEQFRRIPQQRIIISDTFPNDSCDFVDPCVIIMKINNSISGEIDLIKNSSKKKQNMVTTTLSPVNSK